MRDILRKLLKTIEIYPRADIFLNLIVCEFADSSAHYNCMMAPICNCFNRFQSVIKGNLIDLFLEDINYPSFWFPTLQRIKFNVILLHSIRFIPYTFNLSRRHTATI